MKLLLLASCFFLFFSCNQQSPLNEESFPANIFHWQKLSLTKPSLIFYNSIDNKQCREVEKIFLENKQFFDSIKSDFEFINVYFDDSRIANESEHLQLFESELKTHSEINAWTLKDVPSTDSVPALIIISPLGEKNELQILPSINKLKIRDFLFEKRKSSYEKSLNIIVLKNDTMVTPYYCQNGYKKWLGYSGVDLWQTYLQLIKAQSNRATTLQKGHPFLFQKNFIIQFLPLINPEGNKVVHVNFMCRSILKQMSDIDYSSQYVQVDDGGSCFWEMKVNLSKGKYFDITKKQ